MQKGLDFSNEYDDDASTDMKGPDAIQGYEYLQLLDPNFNN